MPLITGYILVGVLAGPHVLNMVPDSDIRKLDFVDKVYNIRVGSAFRGAPCST